jgi:signal transduction histidine kinase
MNRLARAFHGLSLRWKVIVILLAISAISLLLAAAGLVIRERQDFETQMEQRLVLLAKVVGLNSTAALAFNDTHAATEILAALQSDEHVITGALYDKNGRLFANYLRPDRHETVPNAVPKTGGLRFDDRRAALVHTVMLQQQPIGHVYLLADTEEWSETLWGYGTIVGIGIVVVLTIGGFVAVWLQRLVTEPIVDLAELTRRVGQERNFELRAVKRGDDELGVLVDGFNDMLEEIGKGRSELRKLNEELEDRVHTRTAQLEDAIRELEAFSYSVSHDLRAPLRSIDGFSRILQDEHSKVLNADGLDCLERVRRSAQRMGILIDDLLRLAQVTRTEPNRIDVDLTALAQDVAETLRGQDPERRVQFVIAPQLRVIGDARLIRIALENLFGNAWKFTSKRPEACIEFGLSRNGATPVYFVRDNGAGFEMKYATKLFAPFQRLHTAEEFPGTGIGLATVQRIIRKHGGTIGAEATPDQGAVFYFTLSPSEERRPASKTGGA